MFACRLSQTSGHGDRQYKRSWSIFQKQFRAPLEARYFSK